MAKYLDIAEILEQRVLHGDYAIQEFPTDRELATETGVSTLTVRKAVQHLISRGLMVRRPNGRPAISRSEVSNQSSLNVAMLTTSYVCPPVERWQRIIGRLCNARDWRMRTVGFSHQGDPVVRQTLEKFDGVFLASPEEDPPAAFISLLQSSRAPVVVLDHDWTSYGVRCIRTSSPLAVRRLLDHVAGQPAKSIACLNTQPCTRRIWQRIEQWQLWTATHKEAGDLINQPVKPYDSASYQAYRIMKDLLNAKQWHASALYCTTGAAAKGAMRAFADYGLTVGRDVAVCSADDEGGDAQLYIPSLTCLQDVDPTPYVSICLDWMARKGQGWQGPMLIEPAEVPVFTGESTGSCCAIDNK